MSIKFKYGDLPDLWMTFQELGTVEIDDIQLNVKIARIRSAVKKEWDIFCDERDRIIQKYVNPEVENPIKNLGSGVASIDVQEGKEDEFQEEWDKLTDVEAEVDVEPLTVSMLEKLSLRNDIVTTLLGHGFLVEDN